MKSEWRNMLWGDLATLAYGKALRDYRDGNGHYRVFGTNGPIGWHHEPLCHHSTVVVGRKGAYRGVHYSDAPCFVIDTAFYLEPRIEFDMRWAYYELLTHDINSMDSGSAIPSTSREAFYFLPVSFPIDVAEQRAIGQILGTLDDKIALNQQMNETLVAMARAIFNSWFVDFNPVRAKAEGRDPGLTIPIADLFPKQFEDSELGEIPMGWEIKSIGEAVQCVGGSTPSTKNLAFWNGGTNPFVTPKDMSLLNNPVILNTTRHITDEGVDTISSGRLPPGTVLLSSRAPIGYLAITEVPVSVNQGIIAMICDKELPNYYVLHWAKANMETIKRNAGGTTFAEISKRNFRPIKVIVPNGEVLEAYIKQVEPLYRRLILNVQESNTLYFLRNTLLPKLISGELRVKNSEQFIGRNV